MSDFAQQLRDAMRPKEAAPKKIKPVFDSVSASDPATLYTLQDIRLKAAAAVQTWCETDDLGEDETNAMRLQALLMGIVDANLDGEIGPDEADFFEEVLNVAWDYLSSKGIPDDDIDLLLNEWDAAAGDRIMDIMNGELPDGDEESMDDVDNFAFGEDQESVFDSAVYKKVTAVRGGKKIRIKKRVSGTVRLSAAQKLGVRKMLTKSHSSAASMRRKRSMRLRDSMGL